MIDDAPMDLSDPDDLNDLVRRVDPDRWLSSRFIGDVAARADVLAIYAYDHELARAPRVASNPLMGEIRLTWWREALDEIFEDRPVRQHPAAQALAGVVARRRLAREPLETLIDARYRELDAAPMTEPEVLDWADAPQLRPTFLKVIHAARSASRALSVPAFPAVAHAALAGRPSNSDFARRLRLTIAVARGRI
jgi:phytoene synthase